MLVGLGNLSVSRKTRRSVLPVAYGLVRNSLEGIVVADCGNQRDNEKKKLRRYRAAGFVFGS